MADPIARIELLARSLREAAAGGPLPRWLLLSRFGVDFLGPALRPTRPAEVDRFGLLRLAALRDVPLFVLDRDPAETGDDALEDALAVLAAGRAGLRGVVQCVAAAAVEPSIETPSIALVRDWLRWGDEDPMRGLPAARLGARYPDLRGWRDAAELALVMPALAAHGVRAAVAVQRRGPSGASAAEFEAMRRLGGELVVEAGAAEMIAALQQGLRGVTLALVLDAALALPPADPGLLAAAADQLLPRLAPLLGDVVVRLEKLESLEAGSEAGDRERDA
jgi:purine nucleoside phosphorylase